MKALMYIIGIAVFGLAIYVYLPSDAPPRRPRPRRGEPRVKKLRVRETADGVMRKGKRMGRNTGKAFGSVDFGGRR